MSMNLFQRANLSAAFFVFTFLVTGIAFTARDIGSVHEYLTSRPETVILSIFIVLFRIKTLLDDHKYFGDSQQDKSHSRFIGFIVAVFSWIFWGLAALSIKDTVRSAEVLLYAILISSLWLFIHMSEMFSGESSPLISISMALRQSWIYFNLAYTFLLLMFIGRLPDFFIPDAKGSIILLVIMNLILLIDYYKSKSYINVLG